jgi:hypothetical protein
MIYRTYASLKSEVLIETDTEFEDFIQPTEVLAYFQDAVNEAARHIQKLGLEDDYFLTKQMYSLTNGLQTLSLPSNILITKIRGLTYSTSDKVYPIKRIVGPKRFEIIENLLQNPHSGEYYRYEILNDSALTGYEIALYPYSYEDRANCIAMRYIRSPIQIVDNDTSLVDVPEFYSFVKAFVKYKIYDKEGSPKAADAKGDLDSERRLMLESLSEMVPDYGTEITGDVSIYEEMS